MNRVSKQGSRIGLALGSGSARGLAHIGVIRALGEAGIAVDCVVGASMGALIGAVHAAGKLDDLENFFRDLDWKKTTAFFDVVLPRSGLLDGAKISDLVRDHVPAETIESLPLVFAAVASDLASGEEVVIRDGDIIEAVRASISVPGIFTPVRRDGRILVDGGLVNPVPVTTARALGAEIVIAVDLNHGIVDGKNLKPLRPRSTVESSQAANESLRRANWTGWYAQTMQGLKQWLLAADKPGRAQLSRWLEREEYLPNIFEVLLASINIMETQIARTRLQIDRPDILIQPPLGHVRFLEFGRADEIIAIGYESARQHLATLDIDAVRGWRREQETPRPC
mgnify:CR=1 FL=1